MSAKEARRAAEAALYESERAKRNSCTICKERIRTVPTENASNDGYLLENALTVTTHKHNASSETRRYCPTCRLVVEDALLGIGFTFERADSANRTTDEYRALVDALIHRTPR